MFVRNILFALRIVRTETNSCALTCLHILFVISYLSYFILFSIFIFTLSIIFVLGQGSSIKPIFAGPIQSILQPNSRPNEGPFLSFQQAHFLQASLAQVQAHRKPPGLAVPRARLHPAATIFTPDTHRSMPNWLPLFSHAWPCLPYPCTARPRLFLSFPQAYAHLVFRSFPRPWPQLQVLQTLQPPARKTCSS